MTFLGLAKKIDRLSSSYFQSIFDPDRIMYVVNGTSLKARKVLSDKTHVLATCRSTCFHTSNMCAARKSFIKNSIFLTTFAFFCV